RAKSAANAVVYSATPTMTGTRPLATSFAASSTAIFSLRASEQFSPTVPQTISPATPSRMSASITRRVASRSREKSSRNCVVTAGNTPSQPMRAAMPSSLVRTLPKVLVCRRFRRQAVQFRQEDDMVRSISRRRALQGFAVATAGVAAPSLLRAQTSPLVLGVLTPLTGAGGFDGPRMLKAMQAGRSGVNGAGGGSSAENGGW